MDDAQTVAGVPARALVVAEVYDAQADFVWRTLSRLGVARRDLPDLLQEVFVVVHRHSDRFDATRPLRPWLYGICVGHVRNYRKRAFRRTELLQGAPAEASAEHGPEDALDREERVRAGQEALASLDPEHRAVFVMFEVEGMSGKDIAELLDVPLGTVHSRLHSARRTLAAALELVEKEGRA